MKGSIRLMIGFLLVFGAVGGMDFGLVEDFYYQLISVVIGLMFMASAVKAINHE